MATLTVWKFDAPESAQQVERELLDLQKQELIKVVDAATVSWPAEARKPRTKQLTDLTGAGALAGSFWGLLFGLIFLMPLLGAAVGAAAGALGGKLADVGIDDDFIKAVTSEVTPGTSALFLLSEGEVVDRVKEAIPKEHAELIRSNLDREQEAALREVFEG
ncbi:DUF1269 domain-containing protein [Streptomyces sp. NPDC001743]|uniref:DUF1269 domain-containing protein n=1 Tax=Streptomyces sp. NPDC001743 TaxID=3154397 RepID=UPI00331C705C